MAPGHRKVMQYATVASNAGFLGNPVAEGVFGSVGLALASVYLIPQRIVKPCQHDQKHSQLQ